MFNRFDKRLLKIGEVRQLGLPSVLAVILFFGAVVVDHIWRFDLTTMAVIGLMAVSIVVVNWLRVETFLQEEIVATEAAAKEALTPPDKRPRRPPEPGRWFP